MSPQFLKRSLPVLKKRLSFLLPAAKIAEEQPLRAELFNVDQFMLYAGLLASRHSVSFKRGREILLSRLRENEGIILRAYELLNQSGSGKRRISPAGDWLLDNYYLIEEQIRLAQKFLPKGYSRELPNLTAGPLTGYPRVYDIAMEIVSHGDGRLDIKGVSGFVSAYQDVKHLKLGELWAVPIMIRLALIENLRRIASRMIVSQLDRDTADYRAGRILEVLAKDTSGVILEIASMAKLDLPMSDSFVAEFVRRLHGQSPAFNLPIVWLEKKLAEKGQTIERLIQSANQKQAADQVSIANTIESLRFLEVTDWHDFVESLSVVEKELRQDPSGDYALMSFATRDSYRHTVEKLARRSAREEPEVAALAAETAREAKASGEGGAAAHIGYYLVDRGLERLCRRLGLRLRLRDRLRAKKTALPFALYTGSIILLTFAAAAAALLPARELGLQGWPWFAAFGLPLLFVASQAAIMLVNWFFTKSVEPKRLPKMDFSEGIPAHAHTLTVIPTMLSGPRAVEALLEGLEVCYLGNTGANVEFALLTDFPDAAQETLPGDAELLELAQAGIERLNNKYRPQRENIFYLFHRPRLWNERDKAWMGFERKRGKLSDLNALLRGRGTGRFSLVVGDPQRLQDVKYVITLDTDTRMPRDAARDLAGIIAHPLNRPVYDEEKRRVVSGYGILQPRVDLGYPGDDPSLFIRIFGGEPGIDPYTKAVSDLYQDLFYEGSFIGKGLYDVDIVKKSLGGRLPGNLVLSHDLLEGCYARSALVTDVQLYEKFPSGYLADVNRRHRWIRGDWQISGWLLPFVPGAGSTRERNPLSLLSRWKIFDNLRRSVVPAAAAWLLLAGWFFFEPAWFWAAVVVVLYGFPALFIFCVETGGKSGDITVKTHLNSALHSLCLRGAQFGLSLAFLAHEAFYGLHAIAVTCWRMFVSRRRLLEWRTSGEAELQPARTITQYAKGMPAGPLAALLLALIFLAADEHLDILAAAFCGLWLLSPAIACLISRPQVSRKAGLSEQRLLFLGGLSRRIWGFFETFVTARDNWLPPDNFQEEFLGAVAHRTSPTNIGLSLLSNLAACDFGYVSMGTMFNRTEKTLRTMSGMEKYRGHFYNWYDTQSLKPLKPLYISSVDSGNMAGHLLVLRSGLLEMTGNKIVSPKVFDGLADTLVILQECLAQLEKSKISGAAAAARKVSQQAALLGEELKPAPDSVAEMHALLRRLSAESSKILSGLEGKHFYGAGKWLRAFDRQCYDCLEDMAFIAPWLLLAPEIPGMWDGGDERQAGRLALLRQELRRLDAIPALGEAAGLELKLFPLIDGVLADLSASGGDTREKEWFTRLRGAVKETGDRASERISAIEAMALSCTELSGIEFEFLYNKGSHLLSIGYNVSERRVDPGCYDLLASESRLCSFVAIAQGKLPQKHWFMLGRLLSKYGGDPVLVSWGGSMFEYLMPLLVMPVYEGTLLERTYKAMVACQIKYASDNNIPWGISESGYNKLDAALSYQYRSFGVPDIGFKRGLSEDLVVAPYASILALMVEPDKACANLERLGAAGFGGEYGFYEAVDYTPSRAAHDGTCAVVKSYMAHHQGMSLLSLAYLLQDRPMQRRFLADPMFKATELLLQERVPKAVSFIYDTEVSGLLRRTEESDALSRVFTTPNTPAPEAHLLSNGRYNLMVTNSGGGYTRWKDLAVTRWHEDAVMEGEGTFIYLRDVRSGEFWSSAYQPTLKKPGKYEAIFSRSRAEFRRRDHDIGTHTEIAVSPEDNIDLRRVHVRNLSRDTRIIELTSCAEVVLNQPAADHVHRAFSNLFVQTEIIRSHQAIICSRRPRSEKDKFPFLAHFMAVHGNSIVGASYETDRDKFIGRGNTLASPAAMRGKGQLSDSEGPVLDPIVSIRCRVKLEPGEEAVVDYVTGVCDSRDAARALIEKYRDRNLADRVFDLAWTHGQVALEQINATESDAQVYGRLASAIIFANPEWRAHASVLRQNLRGQTDLWGYGISGDLPIVIVRIEDEENIGLIARMVQAHAYWRMKGLPVDLVIWNENSSVYRDALSEKINDLVLAGAKLPAGRPGGIFSRRADQMSDEDKILMQTVARIVLSDRGGTLAEHLDRVARLASSRLLSAAAKKAGPEGGDRGPALRPDLVCFNGLGGFTRDGREYVISTGPSKTTPAPWVNVLANRHFGAIVSESGGAYTWSENAQQFRLTPWKNDPVTDACGEALYVRDEETGRFWSPTPLPAGNSSYVTRHGFGYSIFEHSEDGITTELTVFVPLDQPVKFAALKIRNVSGRKRALSTAAYYELVLGTLRDSSHMHIVTGVDPKSGALTACNHYNKEFPGRVVFLDVNETTRFISGDRREFIGRNGTLAAPAAMLSEGLSGKVGAGLDPCAAMQVKFELDENEEKDIIFTFGAAKSADEARGILRQFGGAAAVRGELKRVWEYWKRSLGVVYVETPDESVNFLVNGWLQYQVLSCRLWGRSGYYQSGGAYGFRDQLQDVMALTHSHPALIREQLLTFASHQFVEGDVQHWWHPPSGRGVRSHCSDDYLWLPLVTCLYVSEIGDTGVLDETVSFLEGPPVKPEEESYYDLPKAAGKTGTLYEHCVRAVKHSLKFGVHGLPLMGSGDWNDGMNLVGHTGKGESVWLGFFLCHILKEMSALAAGRADTEFSAFCLAEAEKLSGNIEASAWDGQWYKRAYFDNGEALGSAANSECRIDSLPQSWAVISGAADSVRAAAAMDQVDRRLADRNESLIKLFEPPFDKCACDPGYIKGYLPGVRENGGQYTHAAVWSVIAFAMLKDSKRAWELLGLINPVRHGDTPAKCAVYKVEPFVMPGDVYAGGPNAGRGGWTWYSGSASWMYQLIVKHLLGIRLKVDRLCFEPCLPADWRSFKMHYRYRETFYHINIERSGPADNVVSVTVDGKERGDKAVPLADDRAEHRVEVRIG